MLAVSDQIRLGCVQMTSRADKAANLAQAERLVARAAREGADVVVLPEKGNGIGTADDYRALAEPLDSGASVAAMAEWARRHGIVLVGGSITELPVGRGKLPNTCCVFDRDGTRVGFDLELTHAFSSALDIPVIASGGVGNLDHLADGVTIGGADAVLAASIFHYGEFTVRQAKERMAQRGIEVRL